MHFIEFTQPYINVQEDLGKQFLDTNEIPIYVHLRL